jgi:hypothetical protein
MTLRTWLSSVNHIRAICHDCLSVSGVNARDRDISDNLLGLHPHEVDRSEHRLGIRDRAAIRADAPPCCGMCKRIVTL